VVIFLFRPIISTSSSLCEDDLCADQDGSEASHYHINNRRSRTILEASQGRKKKRKRKKKLLEIDNELALICA